MLQLILANFREECQGVEGIVRMWTRAEALAEQSAGAFAICELVYRGLCDIVCRARLVSS